MVNRRVLLHFAVIGLCTPVRALAHHATGGEVPQTQVQGLVSGLAHPVLGVDHLLFLVAAGTLAYRSTLRARVGAVALLISGVLAGTALHLGEIDLPIIELLVALSIVAVGAALLVGRRFDLPVLSLLLPLAGTVHGYAFAESIVGAQGGPLFAYLAGLAIVQGALILGVATLFSRLDDWPRFPAPALRERCAGWTAIGAGMAFVSLGVF